MAVVMEIIAPHGSCRIEAFPSVEEFYDSEFCRQRRSWITRERWLRMRVVDRYNVYFKAQKKIAAQHSQGIKAFMKQHRRWGKNGHKRKAV